MSDGVDNRERPAGDGSSIAAPAPKSRRASKRAPKRGLVDGPVRIPRFSDLGDPPIHDPLAMNAYTHRALGISLVQTLHDPDLTEGQRRDAMAMIAGRMAALTPQSRIFGAESVVRGEAAGLTQGNGPELESVNASPIEIDPTSSGRAARRGRPRKRGLA
jgi:hypothetical protein